MRVKLGRILSILSALFPLPLPDPPNCRLSLGALIQAHLLVQESTRFVIVLTSLFGVGNLLRPTGIGLCGVIVDSVQLVCSTYGPGSRPFLQADRSRLTSQKHRV